LKQELDLVVAAVVVAVVLAQSDFGLTNKQYAGFTD
jgi:hypothetical protein